MITAGAITGRTRFQKGAEVSETTTEPVGGSHFDTAMHAYERWGQPQTEMFSRAALDTAVLPEGSEVLDVCADMGALAVPAAERGYRGDAIDTSPTMIRRASERLNRYPGWSAELMDALDLRFGANRFDAAFSVCWVVYFGPNAGQALAEMLRVVRPGGLIVVVNFSDAFGGPSSSTSDGQSTAWLIHRSGTSPCR